MSVTQLRGTTQVKDATISTIKLADHLITPVKISSVATDDFLFPRDITATRTLKIGDGDATTPSLTFSSDPLTGFYKNLSIDPDATLSTVVRVGGTYATGEVDILDYTNLSGATVTVAGHTLTEGVEWTAATSNIDTATSLATAISALSEVEGTATPVGYVTAEAQITFIVEGMSYGTTITIGTRTYTFVAPGTATQPTDWEESTNPDNTYARTASNFLNAVYADPMAPVHSGSVSQNIGDSGIGTIASPRIFYISALQPGTSGNSVALSTSDPSLVTFTAPTLDISGATTLAGGVDGTGSIGITSAVLGTAGDFSLTSSANPTYLTVANTPAVDNTALEAMKVSKLGLTVEVSGDINNASLGFGAQGFYATGSGVGVTSGTDFTIPTDNVLNLGLSSSADWSIWHDSATSSLRFTHNGGTHVMTMPDAGTGIQLVDGGYSTPAYGFVSATGVGISLTNSETFSIAHDGSSGTEGARYLAVRINNGTAADTSYTIAEFSGGTTLNDHAVSIGYTVNGVGDAMGYGFIRGSHVALSDTDAPLHIGGYTNDALIIQSDGTTNVLQDMTIASGKKLNLLGATIDFSNNGSDGLITFDGFGFHIAGINKIINFDGNGVISTYPDGYAEIALDVAATSATALALYAANSSLIFNTVDNKIILNNNGTDSAIIDTTGLHVIDGSEANPSYSFISDPTSGMFLDSSGFLAFSYQGSEALRFQSSNNQVTLGSWALNVSKDGVDNDPSVFLGSQGGVGFSTTTNGDYVSQFHIQTMSEHGTALVTRSTLSWDEAHFYIPLNMDGTNKITNLADPTLAQDAATKAYVDSIVGSQLVVRETPSGTVDGSNMVFTLAFTPVMGSESVFLNGILQDQGIGEDYTILGAVITFASAPASGSKIRVNYEK